MAAADTAMTSRPDREPGPPAPDALPALDRAGDVCIALEGRLDALRALPLRAELDELVVAAAAHARGVLVDLTDVVFVDSAALAALVRLRRQCVDADLQLSFVKPLHSDALRIFRLTQFDEVFVMLDGRPR